MYRVTLYPTTDTQYLAAVNHGGLCCPEQLDMPINYAEPVTEIRDGHWTANTMRESDTAIGGNETYAGFKTLTHTIYKNTNSPGKLHPLNGFQAGELVVIAPITTRGPRSSARSSKLWATMQVTGTVARGRSRHTVASSRRVAPLVAPLVGHGRVSRAVHAAPDRLAVCHQRQRRERHRLLHAGCADQLGLDDQPCRRRKRLVCPVLPCWARCITSGLRWRWIADQ